MTDFQLTGTTSFPICRLNSPACSRVVRTACFICAGGVLNAFVAKTRTVEECPTSRARKSFPQEH
jgi:hypothetical protein